MPIVTAIARQKRNDGRYSISVDGKYAFALPDLELSASNLRVGIELTDDDVAEWQRRAGQNKAYDQALRYISIRRRSRREIEQYLMRKDWEPEVVDDVVVRLQGAGLIDDAAFAAAWVRERQLLRPRSTQMLRAELAKLGVARDDVDTALEAEGGNQVDTIVEIIGRKQRQYADKDKLMAYLARQGFRYDQIKAAYERLSEQ